jgi:hypothetical protein
MSDEQFLRYIRLLLRHQAKHDSWRRVYDDDVLHVEDSQEGIKVVGCKVPRGLILNWKRTGLYYETDRFRRQEEENHLEGLVVLYAMAEEM